MSGKTKKQKLATQLRKRIRLEQIYQSVAQPSSSSTFIKSVKNAHNSQAEESPTSTIDRSYQSSPQETKAISYFYTDFRKSILFVTAIIALEIALYFVNIKNYLR